MIRKFEVRVMGRSGHGTKELTMDTTLAQDVARAEAEFEKILKEASGIAFAAKDGDPQSGHQIFTLGEVKDGEAVTILPQMVGG